MIGDRSLLRKGLANCEGLHHLFGQGYGQFGIMRNNPMTNACNQSQKSWEYERRVVGTIHIDANFKRLVEVSQAISVEFCNKTYD